MEMHLYCWRSEFLKDWAPGDIMVMATSVEEAREKSRATLVKEVWSRYFWNYAGLDELDEDQMEDYRSYIATFEDDIRVEPTVIDGGVALIHGSA